MNNVYEGCRVCGYEGFDAWSEGKYPSYDICDSCGTHIGIEDNLYTIILKRRKEWVDNGMKWWSTVEEAPINWSPKKQLENIPDEFK